jgi:uncharacterized membrane protein
MTIGRAILNKIELVKFCLYLFFLFSFFLSHLIGVYMRAAIGFRVCKCGY